MKRSKIAAVGLALALLLSALLSGCLRPDKHYHAKVGEYPFWANDITEAIPGPQVGQRVRDFLKEPSADGRAKKVAFIGYDGCRADNMLNLFDVSSDGQSWSSDAVCSGIMTLLKDERAGIYLSYQGGNRGTPSEQHTSTGPGWSAMLTGVWNDVNGVNDNGVVKKIEAKTFMLESALGQYGRTYTSTFGASWNEHFATTYSDEVDFLREKAGMEKRETQNDDELRAYVQEIGEKSSVPMRYEFVPDDAALLRYMLSCVTEGDPNERDVTFGIFEATDHAGHACGFGISNEYIRGLRNEDEMAYRIIQTIYGRPSFEKEDWLIIITTDHGGFKTWHGGQTSEERTTWIVCNQGFGAKYYSVNYDGYGEHPKSE